MKMYKDMMIAKGSRLYELVVEQKRKDQKAVDKEYDAMNKLFTKQCPQCDKEWFNQMNGEIV